MMGACIMPLALAAMLQVETGTPYHCAVLPATNLTARIELDGETLAQWKDASVYEFDLPWHAVPGPLTFEVYDFAARGLCGGSGDGRLNDFVCT